MWCFGHRLVWHISPCVQLPARHFWHILFAFANSAYHDYCAHISPCTLPPLTLRLPRSPSPCFAAAGVIFAASGKGFWSAKPVDNEVRCLGPGSRWGFRVWLNANTIAPAYLATALLCMAGARQQIQGLLSRHSITAANVCRAAIAHGCGLAAHNDGCLLISWPRHSLCCTPSHELVFWHVVLWLVACVVAGCCQRHCCC